MLICWCSIHDVWAQGDVEFTLRKAQHVDVAPATAFLIAELPNRQYILLDPVCEITDTLVVGGTYERWERGILITPLEDEVVLFLTASNDQGEEFTFKKTYETLPAPDLLVGKIACDSTGNIWDLLMDGELHLNPNSYGLSVQSFDLEFVANQELFVLSSSTNQFSREMRKSLMDVKDGTLLQLTNIKLGGLHSEMTLPGCQVYITEEQAPVRYSTGGNRVIRK